MEKISVKKLKNILGKIKKKFSEKSKQYSWKNRKNFSEKSKKILGKIEKISR